ncbi:AraC family transcriptional regulator [Alphaproteobacteria bacterium 46_93_T64]|nr:AraC family transcriptional regulator [Alphaproteobacteria bacterium 46_93_T64]
MNFEHIFNEMEIDAEPFALCELHGKSDLGLGRRPFSTLHYILAGKGEIVFQDRPSIPLHRGTLILVPALQSHTLRSFGEIGQLLPNCYPEKLDLIHHHVGDQALGQQDKLVAVCSQVKIGLRGVGDLIDLVRHPIVEQVDPNSAMASPVGQLLQEMSKPELGSRAMIRVLLMQCMIFLLRQRLDAGDPSLAWMAALVDQKLWTTLQLILDDPGKIYTVESLAELAGMSRSTFAKRFSNAYGNGPMELLRTIRMNRAASMLSNTDLPIKRISLLAGFQSRSAFTRAFEVVVGATPGHFRRNSRNQ